MKESYLVFQIEQLGLINIKSQNILWVVIHDLSDNFGPYRSPGPRYKDPFSLNESVYILPIEGCLLPSNDIFNTYLLHIGECNIALNNAYHTGDNLHFLRRGTSYRCHNPLHIFTFG
ncbi:MAG: hypothetical protein A4E58_00201 [Syntrophorhabdus sp. PtaB.Bin006]|nr:MAG: hypothetical protein A4E58_00201 [Syntrophorhabdus sp. PtaB.Bin006]